VSPYEIGEQPCATFDPKDDVLPGLGNVHECFGPYDGRPRGCDGTVSFCKSCVRDHHSNGWQTCGEVTRESE
jgi:hypothetical protein